MHNLISFNQLADWHQSNDDDHNEMLISDYFECLSECDENSQTCKRVCRFILTS